MTERCQSVAVSAMTALNSLSSWQSRRKAHHSTA